ncbi:MAG: hypothetical protein GVY32_05890, partial [Gammaproteobacteria bacterium]|nr:hypothetical protein [Gammaproteobacteria bacterium]
MTETLAISSTPNNDSRAAMQRFSPLMRVSNLLPRISNFGLKTTALKPVALAGSTPDTSQPAGTPISDLVFRISNFGLKTTVLKPVALAGSTPDTSHPAGTPISDLVLRISNFGLKTTA